MLATVEDALRRGSDVTVSGFGKFHVSQRGARAGRQPAHRGAIQIAASSVPRFTAGSALKSAVKAADAARSFGDTLAARVAERESQIVLGLDPDPRALWPEGLERAPAGLAPAELAASAVRAHCRALIDATAEACVAVKLQLARFEALGAPGWGAAARARRVRARARACW